MPNASLEISTVRAKTQGRNSVSSLQLILTEAERGSEMLTLLQPLILQPISLSPPRCYNMTAVNMCTLCICVFMYVTCVLKLDNPSCFAGFQLSRLISL